MGAEAKCTVRFQGTVSSGRALLETEGLIFRGRIRLVIPYRDIRRVEASDGALKVTFSGGVAVFELGAKASVWAEKIHRPKGVLDKLGVKAGATVIVLDVRDREFRAALDARGAKVTSRLSAGAASPACRLWPGCSDRMAPCGWSLRGVQRSCVKPMCSPPARSPGWSTSRWSGSPRCTRRIGS